MAAVPIERERAWDFFHLAADRPPHDAQRRAARSPTGSWGGPCRYLAVVVGVHPPGPTAIPAPAALPMPYVTLDALMPNGLQQFRVRGCLHGFSDPVSCDYCRPLEYRSRPTSAASDPRIEILAENDGGCPGCGSPGVAGETPLVRARGLWVCESCG